MKSGVTYTVALREENQIGAHFEACNDEPVLQHGTEALVTRQADRLVIRRQLLGRYVILEPDKVPGRELSTGRK